MLRTGSLSAAAKHLKLTPMSATRRLVGLEEELGVRLLYRTS
ncbi:helix-turn-helix domain-containing protein [Microvirga roseola]|nr:LysR family transcriptional regulator [Microvirga roseola]